MHLIKDVNMQNAWTLRCFCMGYIYNDDDELYPTIRHSADN